MQSPIFPTDALWAFARTPRGRLAGLLLVAGPALAGPLPVDGGARAGVSVLAVLAGTVGALLVFGGLLTRAYGSGLERLGRGALLLWAAAAGLLVAAVVAFVAGTRGGWAEHGPEVLMFALPAVAAAAAAWRAGRPEVAREVLEVPVTADPVVDGPAAYSFERPEPEAPETIDVGSAWRHTVTSEPVDQETSDQDRRDSDD